MPNIEATLKAPCRSSIVAGLVFEHIDLIAMSERDWQIDEEPEERALKNV